MKITQYQIDAFAEHVFEGNPAAVVPLQEWLPEGTMQAIAAENNLAETAFFVPSENGFRIRWFTPNKEVRLCGHATLATAHVLFEERGYGEDTIRFDSLSGPLSVTRAGESLTLDFPAQKPEPCDIPEELVEGLGKRPLECYRNEDYVAVFDREDDVAAIIPDHRYLERLDLRGVIVTAPSIEYDFVSRFFAPRYGIPEDPVTGSAYTRLTPYWAERLDKTTLYSKQISPRGGKLKCEVTGDRVLISGSAVMFMKGEIHVPW